MLAPPSREPFGLRLRLPVLPLIKENPMPRFRARLLPSLLLTALCILVAVPAVRAADIPASLAGIGLGDEAKHHKGRIRLDKARNMDASPWLRRLPVTGDKYFSGGYVLVGTCAAPGRIVRIKLRYHDTSVEFFRKLAGDMLGHYGDPAEYKGDFEGRTMGNKWSFTDASTRPVSLILQHTEGEDPELGIGTTIKLTNWGLLEAERACYQERHAPAMTASRPKATAKDNGYLPQ
jgi:hypothetical protein